MNSTDQLQLSPALRLHADALATMHAEDSAATGAQQRLLARLASAPQRHHRRVPRLLAAAAAGCAVVALGVAMFFGNLAAPGGGVAFADVQRQLANFEAMTMRMVQSHAGQPIQQTRVTTVRDGRTRVDVGDQVSVIVDPQDGVATTLLHGPRQALTMRVPAGELPEGGEALEWLEALREFQGEALPLAQPREIGGKVAHGWALEVEQMDIVLWATDEGLPLEMTLSDDGGLLLDFSFDFEPTLTPGLLDTAIPAGYEPME